ncbi:MAG: divergent polysaccharide deacetylase family protein [Spirochaetaceae bacterium]|nr:divergent polysaccharide deacetylase family protein [Spirochaetaceae bacterium]
MGKRRNSNITHRRRGGKRATSRMAFLAVIVLALAATFSLVQCRCSSGQATTSTTQAPTPTTLWPYGQPEYYIEVPEGYEGLLPQTGQDSQTGNVSGTSANSGKDAQAGSQAGSLPGSQSSPEAKKQPAPSAPKREKAEPYIAVARKTREAAGLPASPPTLIIVIDDVGYNLDELKPFLDLPFPLTVAVLPQVDHTKKAAAMAAAAGKEVILHQPMQALGGNDLGPGGIYLDSKAEDIQATVTKNLNEIPQAVGMNNHMGSAVTRDEKTMRIVLDIAKRHGIYYLDSLTAPDTVTASLCRELSIPYWERDVFLDNEGDKESIAGAIEEGKKTASARGAAVLIGHVWSSELAQTLMDIYPQLVEQGYSLSTISHYMITQAKSGEDENVRPGD